MIGQNQRVGLSCRDGIEEGRWDVLQGTTASWHVTSQGTSKPESYATSRSSVITGLQVAVRITTRTPWKDGGSRVCGGVSGFGICSNDEWWFLNKNFLAAAAEAGGAFADRPFSAGRKNGLWEEVEEEGGKHLDMKEAVLGGFTPIKP